MLPHWFWRVRSHTPTSVNRPLAAFYLVLISAVFGLSVFVPRFVGNLVVLAAYIVFTGVALTTIRDADCRALHTRRWPGLSALPFRSKPVVLLPTVILWAVFIIGLGLNFSPEAVLRTGAFVVLSAVTLFVMPAVVSRAQAFTAIAVVGAACVVIGLPFAVVDVVTLFGVTIDRSLSPILSLPGLTIRAPLSVFDGLNYFRVLVALGAVGAAGMYAHTREPWLAGVCALNLLGVYLTAGRAARLVTLVAAVLAATYLIAGRRTVAGVTAAGALVTVVGFAVGLGLLPGPTAAIQSALGDRLDYWAAAYETVLARPVLGWGLVDTDVAIGTRFAREFTGVHNSYLRLFVIGGVVGGMAYLALCVSVVVTAFNGLAARAPLSLTAFCLVVMALIFQLFAGGTVFGTSLSSILWLLTFAFAQPTATDRNVSVAHPVRHAFADNQ
jgi:O-antigen ligase